MLRDQLREGLRGGGPLLLVPAGRAEPVERLGLSWAGGCGHRLQECVGRGRLVCGEREIGPPDRDVGSKRMPGKLLGKPCERGGGLRLLAGLRLAHAERVERVGEPG